jgi:hypothetical protein
VDLDGGRHEGEILGQGVGHSSLNSFVAAKILVIAADSEESAARLAESRVSYHISHDNFESV